jgi:hypothetical protein
VAKVIFPKNCGTARTKKKGLHWSGKKLMQMAGREGNKLDDFVGPYNL